MTKNLLIVSVSGSRFILNPAPTLEGAIIFVPRAQIELNFFCNYHR